MNMKTTEGFSAINAEQLREVNGGGFAYDIGRIIRFIGLSGGSGMYATHAIMDWIINDAANKAVNS